MKIKDGGASIAVDQATELGEGLSKAIIELLLLLLELIRDSGDDDNVRHDVLKELENIRDQLELRVSLCETLKAIHDESSITLTPAERLYGRGCNFENIEAYKQGTEIKQPQSINKLKASSFTGELNL